MFEKIINGWKYNKNVRLGVIAFILVACAAMVWIAIYFAIQQQSKKTQLVNTNVRTIDVNVNSNTNEKTTANLVERRIDGVLVETEKAEPYPVGIMIENAAFDNVRPQAGLSKAHVVYEGIVEGGITRFLAIFAADFPDKIGPVRSARPTYLEFISEYDALYGHAGGSPEAVQSIDGLGLKDLTALGSDGRFYYRDTAKTAPHNLFTTSELIGFALRDKSLSGVVSEYDSWKFKDESPIEDTVDENSEEIYLDIDFGSGPLYEVRYVYNAKTNSYDRYNGGDLQKDANTDDVISAKNVIVQMVPAGSPAGDEGRINFSVTGEGKVYIARDGELVEGTWKKTDRLSRTQFYGSDGENIELNRGNTWIAILPETGTLTHN